MQYGVYLPNFGAFGNARTLAELANDAESAGWDGFFIWDHVARAYPIPIVDPWVALSAVAMNTRKIRIGALVTPLARRRPWKVARESISLDHLSNGRLIFGAGLGSSGGRDAEWANFGEENDLAKRAHMLDEGLDILNGLWSGQPFDYHGVHYQVTDAHFLPTPLQFPRIPVWIAGMLPNQAPLERASHWDGVFPISQINENDVQGQVKELMEAVAFIENLRENHDSVFDVVYRGRPTPGDDPAHGAEIVAPFAAAGATWWLENISPVRLGLKWADHWTVEPLRERILQGPPKA